MKIRYKILRKIISMAELNPHAIVQSINISDDDLKFQTPCAISISGPSQSGKSEFIVQLIKYQSQLFSSNFTKIFYCVPETLSLSSNPIFDSLKKYAPNIQLIIGLPDVSKLQLKFDKLPKLIIIDDLMTEFLSSHEMVRLLSVEVHHFNISTIFTLQNIYAPSRFGTTLSRNINYKVLFCNRLDLREMRNLSIQICNQPSFLSESFEFLFREFPNQVAYIVIDGHIKAKFKKLFVRSQIFPIENEIKPIFFFPK